MSLPLMRNNLHLQPATFRPRPAPRLGRPDPRIDQVLDIPLQAAAEVLVEGRAAGEDDVFVEAAADVDGRGLDDAVDDGGERGQEVGGVDFGVEEDFGGEEALVADVDGEGAAVGRGDCVFHELVGFAVVAAEFLDDVRAHVAVFFFDSFGGFQAAVGFPSVAQERLHEVGYVSSGDWDAFDRAADYVALGYGDYVRHAVAGVNDGAGEGAVGDFGGGPGGGEGEDGLDGDVEAGTVEGLEQYFGSVFAVFRGIEGLALG